ncbi:hypothetical protein [Sphingomonas carotinifaciens]|uniref:Uncharacterized protein n=2 Tax=Sphingomonas carotinifaciens TaxID=1166323 RepID=A0A6N8M2K8_9SPHN|nr:hypothetical protein [Sphingomonas carotinifaciens]MWC45632.1 hypothetical protein [Sphingomonas carotinifaciens]
MRSSGSCAGQWGAERVVYTGSGEPMRYPCCEDDYVMIGRDHVERLGTIDAVLAYFEAADFEVPPLDIE